MRLSLVAAGRPVAGRRRIQRWLSWRSRRWGRGAVRPWRRWGAAERGFEPLEQAGERVGPRRWQVDEEPGESFAQRGLR